MTSVSNVSNVVLAQQPEMLKERKNNLYRVNFQAGNDTFVRQDTKTHQRQPQNQYMGYDPILEQQMRMLEEQQKEAKRQKRTQKIATGVGIGAGLAIILTLVLSLFGKGGADKSLKELTTTALKWKDMKGTKTVASLDSKTTSPAVKDTMRKLINKSKLSEKARKWTGSKDGAEIIYMYGHGGVGKTYAAEQFAQEKGAIFASIKYSDLGSPYKDAASMKVTNFFDNIVEKSLKNKDRDIVVCIDEIDAVMSKVKDNAQGAEEAKKIRAAVLTGLDKVRKECKNVTLIATSNYHPKNGIIDPIALRRFNAQIEVPLPNKEQVIELLKMNLKDVEAIKGDKFYKSRDLINFANKLEKSGYSNGEITLMAEEAKKAFADHIATHKIADSALEKNEFTIKYLEEALKAKGEAASITNRLMDVAR